MFNFVQKKRLSKLNLIGCGMSYKCLTRTIQMFN